MPEAGGLQTTVHRPTKAPVNLVEAERRSLGGPRIVPPPRPPTTAPRGGIVPQLGGVSGRIQAVLERKGQVILYGPPGTGKTFWAKRAALDLAAYHSFGKPFAELGEAEKQEVDGGETAGGLVRLGCFHPAYGYEDFIEGYR